MVVNSKHFGPGGAERGFHAECKMLEEICGEGSLLSPLRNDYEEAVATLCSNFGVEFVTKRQRRCDVSYDGEERLRRTARALLQELPRAMTRLIVEMPE